MEFISELPDKKAILKQGTEINNFLVENNLDKVENILKFFQKEEKFLLLNGFMGTGKTEVVNHTLSFLPQNVIILKYECFETTILDDILLGFFDTFKKYEALHIVDMPKAKAENFTQRINAYFNSIDNPIIILINSFNQVLRQNRRDILNFLNFIAKNKHVKIILTARKFEYDEFEQKFEKLSVSALSKNLFEKYLRYENFKQIGPLSDELYKYTRGYYFYTTLSIKIMKIKNQNLGEFLSEYTKSFLSFNDYILREALALVDPVSGHLFRFLTIIRHPVNIRLLNTLNLYNKDKIEYFLNNFLLKKEGDLIYLPDYYKEIADNSIPENIAIKIHKNCIELYETQLPLKPLERDLLISRQTMRKEIEYHGLFIPKKPAIKKQTIDTKYIQVTNINPPTKQEKDEKIKNISFVFESEADELSIMNKIANSINKFVDITGKSQVLDEIKDLTLVDLINLANQEENNFEYKKVIMICQKAITMNHDDDYYTFLPNLYTKLAYAFKKISDWFNAQKYYELAVEFYLSTGDNEKTCENKYEIANIFYITFKADKAKNILKEIINQNISETLMLKAKLLLFDIDGNWYIEDFSMNIKDKSLLAEMYYKYALYSDKMGEIDNAVRYYKKCVETSQDRVINKYLSSSLTNLASIYDEEGKRDMAIKYLQESLRLDELSNNYNGIYISSMKLAEINNSKKTEYLIKAKNCAVELKEEFYIVSVDIAFGDYYAEMRDYKKALEYYTEAYSIAENNFSKDNLDKIKIRIEDTKRLYHEK